MSDKIVIEPDVASAAAARLANLRNRSNHQPGNHDVYEIWNAAGMPKGFQAATSQTLRQASKAMDEGIRLAEALSSAYAEHLAGSDRIELEKTIKFNQLVEVLKGYRAAFDAPAAGASGGLGKVNP